MFKLKPTENLNEGVGRVISLWAASILNVCVIYSNSINSVDYIGKNLQRQDGLSFWNDWDYSGLHQRPVMWHKWKYHAMGCACSSNSGME